ncbi:insulinase family protein [Lagierella sp.]|uniref:insulinase family protein n=1 Tax=Lagierella sp. TaxID=2849657 RepID=UPI0026094F3B|nr:insulinase family protein [Lagierella sp.]
MNINGFKLISEEFIEDISSNVKIFQHKKTNARLMAVENDDDNKVFGIGFRTPPHNSTGVAHISEHCVLNGSRKFKTREPFMDLLKSSMQTFLNAMTFSDKTIYPIASRNDKDFHNLMDVYLDAVFFPAVRTKKEIFLQEGWHYELKNPEDKLSYKGVVYNEMKGSYSSKDTIMYQEFAKGLFPDSIYGNESGGYPYAIPELSYEEFVGFYDKLYHPSNSFIFLYGNMDLEEQLRFIDQEYLSKFEADKIDSEIAVQPDFDSPKEFNVEYSISSEEDPENKDILIYGVRTGFKYNPVDAIVNSIVRSTLFENDGSPLKLALLEAGIGEDIDGLYTDGMEMGLGLVAINTSKEKRDEFKDIIENQLKLIVKEKIDTEKIEAAINKIEYDIREASNFPTKGIIYFISALDTWLYDKDPTLNFKFEKVLTEVREKIDTDYFEKFIEENILNNPNKVIISLEANPGKNFELDKKVDEKLQAYKDNLSKEELDKLLEENKRLEAFQNREDTEEEKATIPKLKLEDIDRKVLEIPTEEFKENNYTVLFHDLFSGKINYITLCFDLSWVKEEDVQYVALLSDLLTKVDTINHSYRDMETKIYLQTGGINTTISTISDYKNPGNYYKKFMVSSKAIGEKSKNMFELIGDALLNSKFDDKNRLKEVLSQIKINLENQILQAGHSIAILRSLSYQNQKEKFNDYISGVSYYDFINELNKDFDSRFEALKEKMEEIREKVFNSNNLIFNVTTDKDEYKRVLEEGKGLIEKFNSKTQDKSDLVFDLEKKNEGITSSSNVNYVTKTYSFKPDEFHFDGSMLVISSMLTLTYIYNNIRAQGGAYGCGMSINEAGNIHMYSYRDPNVKNTVKVYDSVGEYLRNLKLPKEELVNFIIGSLTKFDPPLTNMQKGNVALTMYISGKTVEDLNRNLNEALDTKVEDFDDIADLIDRAMKENYVATIGNNEKIKEDKDIFMEIRPLNK